MVTTCLHCRKEFNPHYASECSARKGPCEAVPEKVKVKRVRSAEIKRELEVANWLYPGEGWTVSREGAVFNASLKTFDITDPKTLRDLRTKLGHPDSGAWSIQEVKGGWRATNSSPGIKGKTESPDLVTLVWGIVKK